MWNRRKTGTHAGHSETTSPLVVHAHQKLELLLQISFVAGDSDRNGEGTEVWEGAGDASSYHQIQGLIRMHLYGTQAHNSHN